jgi:hypothetical protein
MKIVLNGLNGLAVLVFSMMNGTSCLSQSSSYPPGLQSFDAVTDAQSIAMGESSAANPRSLSSFKVNPATLAGVEKANLVFGYRPLNWIKILEDVRYYSIGAALRTKIGCFALDYSRFEMGEVEITTMEDPGPSGEKANPYDHTVTLGYAGQIIKDLFMGINLKWFDAAFGQPRDSKHTLESKPAWLGDIGVLYGLKGMIRHPLLADRIYLGISIQNMGGPYRYKTESMNHFTDTSIPRYWRLGFCYELCAHLDDRTTPFRFMFTAEYRKHLNPSGYYKLKVNYGGAGFEATFFNLVSIRMGGIFGPFDGIYGDSGRLAMRYGIGLNIPLKKTGLNLPASIALGFSQIPIKDVSMWGDSRKTLNAIDVQLRYE